MDDKQIEFGEKMETFSDMVKELYHLTNEQDKEIHKLKCELKDVKYYNHLRELRVIELDKKLEIAEDELMDTEKHRDVYRLRADEAESFNRIKDAIIEDKDEHIKKLEEANSQMNVAGIVAIIVGVLGWLIVGIAFFNY